MTPYRLDQLHNESADEGVRVLVPSHGSDNHDYRNRTVENA